MYLAKKHRYVPAVKISMLLSVDATLGQISNISVLCLKKLSLCSVICVLTFQWLVVRIRRDSEKMVGNYEHFTRIKIVFFFSCKFILITMALSPVHVRPLRCNKSMTD